MIWEGAGAVFIANSLPASSQEQVMKDMMGSFLSLKHDIVYIGVVDSIHVDEKFPRNDLAFIVHDDDIANANANLCEKMHWLEDVYGNLRAEIFPKEFREAYPARGG